MAYKFQLGAFRASGSIKVEDHLDAAAGLQISGSAVRTTVAELHTINQVTAGSADSGKALVLDASKDIGGINDLSSSAFAASEGYFGSDNYKIGNASVPDFITMKAAVVEFKDGALDVDIASHDGSNGLKLGGTLVAATAAELNIMDGGTSASATTLLAADRVVVNDDGVMKQVAMSDFETFMESNLDTLSSVTTVGTLDAGAISANFGAIDNGTSNITSGGAWKVDVDLAAAPRLFPVKLVLSPLVLVLTLVLVFVMTTFTSSLTLIQRLLSSRLTTAPSRPKLSLSTVREWLSKMTRVLFSVQMTIFLSSTTNRLLILF